LSAAYTSNRCPFGVGPALSIPEKVIVFGDAELFGTLEHVDHVVGV
jgi:hypothetical protein